MLDFDFVQCLFFMLIAAAVIGVIYYLATHIRTVEEGHVAVIHRLDEYARTAGPGLYVLGPFEDEVKRVYVRQREATASVPNVFTEGGLPVIVNLRYSYSLDPAHMNRDEIHYSDDERDEQQRTLLKRVFQDLMYEMEQTPADTDAPPQGADADRVNVLKLFSPFAGKKMRTVQIRLEPAVREALLPHGVVVTNAPVLINGLTLPPEISGAYIELLRTDFNSSAQSDFVRRLRMSAPQMTEAGLIQLVNIIRNPSADIHTIFSGGMLNNEVLLQGGQSGIRQVSPLPNQQQGTSQQGSGQQTGGQQASGQQTGGQVSSGQGSAAPPPETPPAGQPSRTPPPTSADDGMDPDYPLTESDNTILKSTREELA
jgi:hypothetical protein